MLNSFRRFTKSRYGLIAVFVFLGLIALAFAASDVTGLRSPGAGGTAVVARVGDTAITDAEVKDRIDRFLRNAQREGQNVTMEQFLAQGGLELAVDEMINAAALVEFAQRSGMQVSKRLIDGEIASNPAFFGIDGKFSQQAFEQLLAQNRISPALFRESMTDERYANWLVNRATIGNQMPEGVVLPYASLLLERRQGTVGLVQTIAMDPGPDPTDAELTRFYNNNRARYTVPERRVVRYALIEPATVRTGLAATDAEIAEAYRKAGDRYAATEKRTVQQLVVLDQATANRIATEVKGGTTIAAAASAAGLEPTRFDGVQKAALAERTAPPVADAAFAAAEGAVVGPVRSPLGWHVLRVEKVEQVAARPLAQVRDELASEIVERKLAQRIADLRQAIDDGIADGKTFDELVADSQLTAQRTPALTAAAADPDNSAYQAQPPVPALMRAGFAFENAGDEPQLVPLGDSGAVALVGLDRVVPAAPRPLAQIRDRVKGDYLMDKALQKARAAAQSMVAKLEKGMSMEQALREAGVTKGPPPKQFDFVRKDVLGQRMEPFIQMAFQMPAKKARLVEAPDRLGYYVVYLDEIEEHSAAGDQQAIARVRGDIAPVLGPEYARQFVSAIRSQLEVSRNEEAIARLRAELTRQGSAR